MPLMNPSPALLAAVFEQHPGVKLLIDPCDGAIIDANHAASAFYGYSRAQLRRMRIFDLNMRPEEEVRERMAAVCARRETRLIFPHQLADGSVRMVEVHSGPVEWGAQTYLLSIISDVTQALQDRADVERCFEIAAEPLVITREDGTVARVNRTFARVLGYEPEEIVGRPALEFIHVDDRERTRLEMARRRADWDTVSDFRNRVMCRDGSVKWLAWDIAGDPERRCVYAAARDITAALSAERALRESELRFRAIANYTYDWESWLAPDGKLLWTNPAVERITGYTATQCLAMRDYPEPLVWEEDRDVIAEVMGSARAGGSGSDVRFRVRCRAGEPLWVAASWQGIRNDHGGSLGVRMSIRDISHRVAQEEERERLLRELRDALEHVKTLRGLLPICAGCKRIRKDDGFWEQIEVYIRDRSDVEFSHGLCPECAKKLFPEFKSGDGDPD